MLAAEMRIEAMERKVSKHITTGKQEFLYPRVSKEIYIHAVCWTNPVYSAKSIRNKNQNECVCVYVNLQ